MLNEFLTKMIAMQAKQMSLLGAVALLVEEEEDRKEHTSELQSH